jgi:pimeloyl-ACP methyl ester carboxylesterase
MTAGASLPAVRAAIATGVLPMGHPYARIGDGAHVVLSIPSLSFIAEATTPRAVARLWRSWLDPIARHDLTVFDVGRRPDLAPGSSAADIADDYAAVIRAQWGRPVSVMGFSSGGGYAQWLAIRHAELVDRLVLAFTGHRITDATRQLQRRAVDHALAGRWRAGYAALAPWFVPTHPRLASAGLWLIGPHVGGRRRDLRPLRIDADADDAFDASGHLGAIRCPTLVASGGRDVAYPPEVTRELVAGIAGARHIDYPDAGHGGPGAIFAEEACAFLAERSEPRGVPAVAAGHEGLIGT